jgi:hypothetical protein
MEYTKMKVFLLVWSDKDRLHQDSLCLKQSVIYINVLTQMHRHMVYDTCLVKLRCNSNY